jgi:hypothetical protein
VTIVVLEDLKEEGPKLCDVFLHYGLAGRDKLLSIDDAL